MSWGVPITRKLQAKVLGCYAGVSAWRTRWSEGCGVHTRGGRDQLEVALCPPCPGVTCTSSFMPRSTLQMTSLVFRGGNGGLETSSSLPGIVQLVSGEHHRKWLS